MTNAAIIQGALVDAKNVGVHKSLRLYIDVPQEMAKEFVRRFGWPTMAEPIPVTVVRLNEEREVMPDTRDTDNNTIADTRPNAGHDNAPPRPPAKSGGAKRSFGELPLPQQAGMLCSDPVFQAFIEEHQPHLWRIIGEQIPADKAEIAAEIVRTLCDVNSRSQIKFGTDAAKQWQQLTDRFRAWRDTGQ